MKTIRIRYHADITHIEPFSKGDWIDLRAAEEVVLKKGDFCLISLGVSMQLPDGYEAIVAPRSSTFKRYGILQTNSFGVIDESYCGDNDVWKMPVFATRDVTIPKDDRICQFRIQRHQPEINFIPVQTLGNEDRGGFGSTGTH